MGGWRRAELKAGVYDEIVSARVDRQLAALGDAFDVHRAALKTSEPIGAVLESLLADGVALALAELKADSGKGIALAEALLAVLRKHAPGVFERDDELRLHAERLTAIVARPAQVPERPRGSLHASSLIVNAEGDRLLEHLRSEFDSADSIDLLCAFVKLSGFEKFRSELERHCNARGRALRVLTTTYMGASDASAIQRMASLQNTTVKVSYDENTTRLHAKAWIFHRASGFSTAFVGSSNLSHAAQTDGLEWNVRITQSDQPALVAQMQETFDQYWADAHQFEQYDHRNEAAAARLRGALSAGLRDEPIDGLLVEVEPKDFQKPVLEELETARTLGRHRNLIVAATGTGKTVMAAMDYRTLREAQQVDTLLYVAHRREILEQARRMFRNVLQMRDFGELLYQGQRPGIGRHVFASIDSLGEGAVIDPSAFDHVILDEAHHAAANSWEALLERVRPKELVGLTATPERADGLAYERHFPRPWVGNLRVWNAIPHALVPFRYYVLDVQGADLRDVAWVAGRYVTDELAGRLVGAAEAFVLRAVQAVTEYIGRPSDLRAIAFCVNVRHAEEVATRFVDRGFSTRVVTGDTDSASRRSARGDLDGGRVQVLCVVDIYNEGVDVPNVNTLFFFRPTESATVFLQQFGRGLRRARGKAELVVFDLTGRQHLQFRFDRRLRSLLGHTPRELTEFVSKGFGRLPAGCHLWFDEQAREDVLAQMRRAIPSDQAGISALLREPAHAALSLSDFLHETDVALDDVYRKDRSWWQLRHTAGLDPRVAGDEERKALKNVHKLIHVGDERRLAVWERLTSLELPAEEPDRRLARMLFVVLYGKEIAAGARPEVLWAEHALLREEIAGLVPVLRELNAVLPVPHALAPEIPLVLHARYLGAELSAAFDHRTAEGKFRDYYTGVEPTYGGKFDLLLVTLDKAAATKDHLRYRDFPLNENRFHWQSKAATTRDSQPGQRHLEPAQHGVTPLLFVRERADDRPGVTMGFRYLGPVEPRWSLRRTPDHHRVAFALRDAARGADGGAGGSIKPSEWLRRMGSMPSSRAPRRSLLQRAALPVVALLPL
jgi:superfamily II DNA or RNA helicase/HKD family nuclease